MDTGNTAWILMSAAMVLLMTPGLAFFYGGLVRERQVINTMKMSFIALGLVSLLWAIAGYSLAFAPGSALIGGLQWLGLSGVGAAPEPLYTGNVPHLAFMVFQMMFAIITPALISGAVVGRMKFRAYALFIALWSLVVYAPVAHWVWGPGGWIREMGALDFAGGTVVHVTAGISALVAALILGPRRRREGSSDRPHNVPFVVLGASLLWFGWFGFNAGSALAADGLAALAFVTTMLGASAGVVTWVAAEMYRHGRPTATGASIGAVVGLVAITPAAGFVTPLAAIGIGMIAAVVSFVTMTLLKRTRLDDTLDVFACHGAGGIVGSVLTGLFATTLVNPNGADGLLAGNPGLLTAQVVGVLAAAAWAALGTSVLMLLVKKMVGLRTPSRAESVGIDITEHAEHAYERDSIIGKLVDQVR